MAKLSEQALEALNEYSDLLSKDKLTEFYAEIAKSKYAHTDTVTEISEFLITQGVDVCSYLKAIPHGFLTDSKRFKDFTIGGKVEEIESGAFYGAHIETLILEDSVRIIGRSAFADCEKLTNVTLGQNVKTIGQQAFAGCTNIKELILPESVTTIGANAFDGNNAITIKSPERKRGTLHVPRKEIDWYKQHLIRL